MKAAALELRTGLANSEEIEQDATSKLEVTSVPGQFLSSSLSRIYKQWSAISSVRCAAIVKLEISYCRSFRFQLSRTRRRRITERVRTLFRNFV
jgi:hypothetical protein